MTGISNANDLAFVTTVRPDLRSSSSQLKAAARMDYWNPEITLEHFASNFSPHDGVVGEQELGLYHFGRYIKNDEATAELKAMGLQRVTEFRPFLAYLAANPDLQRDFPILSGATWRGRHNSRKDKNWVVSAHGDGRRRRRLFDLSEILGENDAWWDICRFIVRRT